MKLIIRDDDLSYFANPMDLEQLYCEVWDKCPISFATIPFVTTQGFETPLLLKDNKLYKIEDNKELVSFLKQKIKEGKITIVQHGHSHKNYGKLYELERKDEKQIYEELKEGKQYLEKVFEIEINTLVAPHDRFSKQAIKAAEKVGYKYICRAFAPMPKEIQLKKQYLKSFFKLFKFWLKHKRKFRYPYLLNYDKYFEIYSYRPNEIINNYPEIIRFHKKHKNSILSVTVHYRSINIHTKELLMELLKETKDYLDLNNIK